MWYCFTTAKGAQNRSRSVHLRPRGFERCTAIFGASFAGLFWALQAPCGVARNWKERHGGTPQIYTTLDHILAHLSFSPWPTKNMQFCRVDQTVLHVDTSLLGVLWKVSQASLTDFTTYLPVNAPEKLTYLTICARWKSSIRLYVNW